MTQKIHFKGLNGLRFYAALSVVIQHIMYSPNDWYRDPSLPDTVGRLFLSGNDHVNLFFVLSGFLIVYLLLKEREQYGGISVRKFYLRRVLRIWPVYFGVIGLVVIAIPLLIPGYVSPLVNPTLAFLLTFFLGNFAFVLYYPYPPLEHLWSIAIEEQFYVVVPHLLRINANLTKILLGFLIIYCIVWFMVRATMPPIISEFFTMMRYDCIAIGGIFACILYYRSSLLKWIYHPIVGYGALAIVAFIAVFIYAELDALVYTVFTCFIFGILILNISTNERFLVKLDHPLLEYGGKLSYSIYMYHPLILLLFRAAFYGKIDSNLYQVVVYPVVIGLTLVFSALSYRFFEQKFLNLKDRFSPLVNKPTLEKRADANL